MLCHDSRCWFLNIFFLRESSFFFPLPNQVSSIEHLTKKLKKQQKKIQQKKLQKNNPIHMLFIV